MCVNNPSAHQLRACSWREAMLSTHSARVELYKALLEGFHAIKLHPHEGQPTETTTEMSVSAPQALSVSAPVLGEGNLPGLQGRFFILFYPVCVPCYFCSIRISKLKNILSIFYLITISSKRASISTVARMCWPCGSCSDAVVPAGFCM